MEGRLRPAVEHLDAVLSVERSRIESMSCGSNFGVKYSVACQGQKPYTLSKVLVYTVERELWKVYQIMRCE